MARRRNASCAGALVLLFGAVMTGCLLAVPVVLPDLLSVQNPPQKLTRFTDHLVVWTVAAVTAAVLAALASRRRPFVWWVVLARTVLLLALASVAARWAESQAHSIPAWNVRALAESGAAGVTALLFHRAVAWWDAARGRRSGRRPAGPDRRTRPGRRPAAGEIWLAMVPFSESKGEARHYCVVMKARFGHADVLQITTKDKEGRRDHIRMPNDGWDEVSGREHWVEIGVPPRRVRYRKFLKSRRQGLCPDQVWAQLQARRPAVPQPSGIRGRLTP